MWPLLALLLTSFALFYMNRGSVTSRFLYSSRSQPVDTAKLRDFEATFPFAQDLHVLNPEDKTQVDFFFLPFDSHSNESYRTILYFHGKDEYRIRSLQLYKELQTSMQANIIVMEYRGYAGSAGTPSRPYILSDAEVVLKWAWKEPKVRRSDILFYGFSLGGAVASELMGRHPEKVKAVILENPLRKAIELGEQNQWGTIIAGFYWLHADLNREALLHDVNNLGDSYDPNTIQTPLQDMQEAHSLDSATFTVDRIAETTTLMVHTLNRQQPLRRNLALEHWTVAIDFGEANAWADEQIGGLYGNRAMVKREILLEDIRSKTTNYDNIRIQAALQDMQQAHDFVEIIGHGLFEMKAS